MYAERPAPNPPQSGRVQSTIKAIRNRHAGLSSSRNCSGNRPYPCSNRIEVVRQRFGSEVFFCHQLRAVRSFPKSLRKAAAKRAARFRQPAFLPQHSQQLCLTVAHHPERSAVCLPTARRFSTDFWPVLGRHACLCAAGRVGGPYAGLYASPLCAPLQCAVRSSPPTPLLLYRHAARN